MSTPIDPVRLSRHFHDRDVTLETLTLLKKLVDTGYTEYERAAILQRYVDKRLNEELELLATEALAIKCEPDAETRLHGPVLRGDWRMICLETASFMRRRCAKMLRDHQRDEEE